MSLEVRCTLTFEFFIPDIVNEQNGLTKHIALVGVTGVGKSTLVNVLSGSDSAKVTNDVDPCTTRPDRYDIEQEGVRYSLWDTRGLSEAREQEAMGPIARFFKLLRMRRPDEDHELRLFLCGQDPKINLILFCIDAEKIRVDAQWKNYRKIYVKFCKRKIKVAVVVTRMGRNIRDTDSWRTTCKDMAWKVVGMVPEAGMVEAVPTFERPEDARNARDCKNKILGLISNFS